MADKMPSTDAPKVDMDDARPRRWGWWLLLLGFGGFLTWALLAPLDAGVSAAGTVVVTGNRKAVQPLVAGKIAAILTQDGAQVTAGQVLVRLDDTASRSQYDISTGQWLTSLAMQARLEAERSGKAGIVFPPELQAQAQDPRAASAMALQQQLLTTRRQALRSELAAMGENLRGLELQMRGTEASRQSKEEQLRALTEQLRNMRALADEGFLARNRVLDQERAVANLTGAMAEDSGSAGRLRQSMAEVRERMLTREQSFRQEVETQLADVQRDAASLRSRLDALQFDLVNAEIRAPAAGVVMGLAVHTVGGVVGAGAPMMEILPDGQVLQIEAQVPPHLIDKVRVGLPVDVLFTAFSQATTPHVPGTVTHVSADVLQDNRPNALPYFKVLVQIAPDGMAPLRGHQVRAGMPAEVFVRVGERTAMTYLTKPLRDRLQRALTEP
jgi:protease secretion system membrane fusion protein